MTLLERIQNIEILKDDSIYDEIHEHKVNNEKLSFEINDGYKPNSEVLKILGEMTGQTIDESVVISQPFYTDYGRHIKLGKEIFINKNVTFVDLGSPESDYNVEGFNKFTLGELLTPFEATFNYIGAQYIGYFAQFGTVNHATEGELIEGTKRYIEFVME